jgi:hypothetical protein
VPVLILVRPFSRFAGASLNLGSPGRLDLVFPIVERREQLSRQLRAILRGKRHRLFEHLLHVLSHAGHRKPGEGALQAG